MTKKSTLWLVCFALFLTTLACATSQPPSAPPAPASPVLAAASEHLPFEGMWISNPGDLKISQVIVLTKDSFYRVQPNLAPGQTNEQFAEVLSSDLANNQIILHTKWIRVNGKTVGFDSPGFTITYRLEGDTLQIGIGWDGNFATELEPIIFTRK
jgi:hypothetical protein